MRKLISRFHITRVSLELIWTEVGSISIVRVNSQIIKVERERRG